MTLIKSRNKRFRRAGIEFSRDGVEVNLDKLSKARREAIEAEPQLVIVDPKADAKDKKDADTKAAEKLLRDADTKAANAAAKDKKDTEIKIVGNAGGKGKKG